MQVPKIRENRVPRGPYWVLNIFLKKPWKYIVKTKNMCRKMALRFQTNCHLFIPLALAAYTLNYSPCASSTAFVCLDGGECPAVSTLSKARTKWWKTVLWSISYYLVWSIRNCLDESHKAQSIKLYKPFTQRWR